MNIHGTSISFLFLVHHERKEGICNILMEKRNDWEKKVSIEIFTAEWLKVIILVKTFLSWFLYVFLKEVSESAIFPDDWFSFSIQFFLLLLYTSCLLTLILSIKPLIFNLISKSELVSWRSLSRYIFQWLGTNRMYQSIIYRIKTILNIKITNLIIISLSTRFIKYSCCSRQIYQGL